MLVVTAMVATTAVTAQEEGVGILLAHDLHHSCHHSALEMPDFPIYRFQQATPTLLSHTPLVLLPLL